MADTPPVDSGAEPETAAEEQLHVAPGVDREAVRRRAYELSQLHPHATAEENWLLAEAELAAATEHDRRAAEADAAESEAALMANIEMTVYGHP